MSLSLLSALHSINSIVIHVFSFYEFSSVYLRSPLIKVEHGLVTGISRRDFHHHDNGDKQS